jgi:phasin family protein
LERAVGSKTPEPTSPVPPAVAAKRVARPRAKPADLKAPADVTPLAEPGSASVVALAAAEAPPAAVPADIPEEETMATVINEAADKAKDNAATGADNVKSMADAAQGRATEAMQKGMKFVEEINDFTKGNVEAMVEASKIAARGAEDIAKYTADYARGSVEKANERARRVASVKSPTELLQLQSEFARETMDQVAQETSKFAEGYLKLLGEIAQPFQNRMALAAEKMKAVA